MWSVATLRCSLAATTAIAAGLAVYYYTRQRSKGNALPTERHVELVTMTWASVRNIGLEPVGEFFFKTIFRAAPGALQLFTSFRDIADYETSAPFKDHARSVMETLDKAVALLGDLESLAPTLRKLGAKHVLYGVQPEHYDIIGAALLETLGEGLGAAFTDEVREAWQRVYGLVSTEMQAGAAKADA